MTYSRPAKVIDLASYRRPSPAQPKRTDHLAQFAMLVATYAVPIEVQAHPKKRQRLIA